MKKVPRKKQFSTIFRFFQKPFFLVFLMGIFGIYLFSSFQNEGDDTNAEDSIAVADVQNQPDTLAADTASVEQADEPEQVEEEETETAQNFIRGEYTKQQKRKGERLFNGLVAFESGQHDCASCHYTEPQKEMNWNPGAYELALVWEKDSTYDLMDVMNNPVTLKMMEDHAGMRITREEQHFLEGYYAHALEAGPDKLKAYPVKAFIFWGLGFLMLLAVIDLIFTQKIKFRALHIFILLIGLSVHGQFAVVEAQNLGRTPGYAPDQPIKFSHQIHAGENETDCQYCHHISDYSISGGIPSNNVCLNCHNVVRNGTNSGRFEINKIHEAEKTGEPVDWIRVHNLPDHSFFSHSQHVNAGQLDCTECHGDVETMHIVEQQETLAMGWCLTCHRDTDVNFTDNPYFDMYDKLHEKIKNGEIDGVKAADLGGEDCMSCHY